MNLKTIIIGVIIFVALAILLTACNGRKTPPAPSGEASGAVIDVAIEGTVFKGLPTELTAVMQRAEQGDIPGYETIMRIHALESRAQDNPEIFLGLAWLQAAIVESGVYIDDLQADFDKGNVYFENYYKAFEPDFDQASYNKEASLMVGDKLDRLEARLARRP